MENISLHCFRCPKCGEEYLTSSELIKFEILSGRRKLIRKFGTLGDSMIIRIPETIKKECRIKLGDYGIFEKTSKGILIKPFEQKKLK